jgi:metal-dependent amidase/aminoacylase/carboxypeptidase family protein
VHQNKIIKAAGCDIDMFVNIRRYIHENPELGFEEVKTLAKIKETLSGFGVPASAMK